MRKLDAAIAEALGYEVVPLQSAPSGSKMRERKIMAGVVYVHPWKTIPHYSTDGNAMLELDAEMRKLGLQMYICSHINEGAHTCEYLPRGEEGDENSFSTAETMPKAVALAAYKALTGEDWQDD